MIVYFVILKPALGKIKDVKQTCIETLFTGNTRVVQRKDNVIQHLKGLVHPNSE